MKKLLFTITILLPLFLFSCIDLDEDNSPKYWFLLAPVDSISVKDTVSSTDTIFVWYRGHTSCDLYHSTSVTKKDSGKLVFISVASPQDNEECDIEYTPMSAQYEVGDLESGKMYYYYFWSSIDSITQKDVFIKDSIYFK